MKDIELLINKDTGYIENTSSFLIQQENLQRKIIFKFKEGFVDGNAYLCIEKDNAQGKIKLTKNEEQYETTIKSNMVSNTKSIKISLRILQAPIMEYNEEEETEEEQTPIFVSKVSILNVAETIIAEDELPEDLPTWQDTVNEEISELETSVENLSNTKQETLVSGENIKTINNQSILGEGNISITVENIDYSNVNNKPQINNITLFGNKSLNDLGIQPAGNYALSSDIPTNTSDLNNDSGFITNAVNNLTNYTLKTNTGSLIDLEINPNTYVITLSLKNQDGTIISTDTIDLPLESVVVGGSYDGTNKKIILTLENGNTVDILVGDLVSGLQTEITSQNKLASDLVDDTNSGNKFVTTSEKSTWNAKYDKPSGGIPKTDLASDVQTSLGKADSALQQHQDITGKEDKTNKTTTIDNESTNTQYPSAKAVYDYVERLHTYSTTEQEVGTWIDGKPIYRNIIKATLPTNQERWTMIASNVVSNIDFLVNLYGIYDTTDTKFIFPKGEGSYHINAQIQGTDLYCIRKGWNSVEVIFIIEYTKTTD